MTNPPEFPVTLTETDAAWLKEQVQRETDTVYKRGRSRGITYGLILGVALSITGDVLRALGIL